MSNDSPPGNAGMKRVQAFVSGDVQGVFFRAFTRDKARELGISGFVRNLRDGRVEIVAEGEEKAVDELIDWARSGPPHARVASVEVVEESPRGDLPYFTVRH
jgi:acylphosphatase